MSDVTTMRGMAIGESMTALVYDRSKDPWDESRGLRKVTVPTPRLKTGDGRDEGSVVIRTLYAGFCGSDRGIWFRQAFKDMICGSLDTEGSDVRITGHEMLGEIVAAGRRAQIKYGYKPGQIVSTESHIICGACYQCRVGDTHVCAEDKIIGISLDGCFAEYLKLPAKSLWATDLSKIRPEVAAIQEPFGNAVHACTKVDLRGKSVVIFGTGTIGLFAVLVARGLGAGRIIGVDPNPKHAEMARLLGADDVLQPDLTGSDPIAADPRVVSWIKKATNGVGADVTLEMSGYNSALNNAIESTRRGGDVILFGIRDGQMVLDQFSKLVMNGVALHSVVGRQIFETWVVTRSLLEDKSTRIQELIWEVILDQGRGTLVDLKDWKKESFEKSISEHPKVVIRIGGEPVLNS
ncbi:MAG: zinc-binding dehydrogenase [Myxococcota bacterium]|nr:zinc-binding dehydrogenase [Myxococcota bacterium]